MESNAVGMIGLGIMGSAMSANLIRAGFNQVEEETHVIPMPWPGPPEELWQHLYEIAAPFRPIVDGLAGP